jgi:membrane protease YdiL (CAAX protease family)
MADVGQSTAYPWSVEVRFLIATASLSSLFWLAGALIEGEWLVAGLPFSAGMFVAPALAVLITRAPTQPARSVGGPVSQRAVPLTRYVTWTALMPTLLAGSYALAELSGGDLPGTSTSARHLALLCAAFTASSVCEELGWTRFLTTSLLRKMSAIRAGVGIGAVWAALHVIPYLQAGRAWDWVAWQCVFTIAFRVLIVTAVASTGLRWGIAVTMHASYDVAWALYPIGGSHYDPALVALLTGAVAAVLRHRGLRAGQAT